jgi:hypothetical protein
MDIEEAKKIKVPFLLCEGLESQVFTLRLVDTEWVVLEKMDDMDVPMNIKEVKDGAFKLYLDGLKRFKVCDLNKF